MPVSQRTTERVLEKINFGLLSDCWEWKGYKVTRGYGGLSINRKIYLAHRLVYAILIGWEKDFSGDIKIRHMCDNPPCVNFTHLRHGTHTDNMRDIKRKPTLICKRGHARTPWAACQTCVKMSARVTSGHFIWNKDGTDIIVNPKNPPIPKTWMSGGKLMSYP